MKVVSLYQRSLCSISVIKKKQSDKSSNIKFLTFFLLTICGAIQYVKVATNQIHFLSRWARTWNNFKTLPPHKQHLATYQLKLDHHQCPQTFLPGGYFNVTNHCGHYVMLKFFGHFEMTSRQKRLWWRWIVELDMIPSQMLPLSQK